MLKSPVDWIFYGNSTNACKLAGDRGCYLPRGKVLGGSSTTNFMVYVRGVPQDFDDWAKMGNTGWDYLSVLPYFKKFEGNMDPSIVGNGFYHSATGPTKIQRNPLFPASQVFFDAFKAAGLPIIPDINANYTNGYVHLQSFAFNGTRSSTAESYLRPNAHRSNLHVIKNGFVTKILINSKNEAYGVEFTYKNGKKKRKLTARARKEVIVSAGSIQSPPLLLRSGIGPKKQLAKFNITQKADLPVGQNLIDHLHMQLLFSFDFPSAPIPATQPLDSIYQYVVNQSGPLASVPYLCAYVDTTNTSSLPDLQFFFTNYQKGSPPSQIKQLIAFTDLDQLNQILIDANVKHAVAIVTLQSTKDKSRGSIELKSKSNSKRPIINCNYLDDPHDRATLLRGIRYFLNVVNTPAMQALNTTLLRVPIAECDALRFNSDDYWLCYIKYVTSSAQHEVGTNKMGVDSSAVVDPQLRVRNIRNLRVIDASM